MKLLKKRNESIRFPSNAVIIDLLDQYARRVVATNFDELSFKKFNSAKFAHIIALGVAIRDFDGFFNLEMFRSFINNSSKDNKENLSALELGFNLVSNEY